MSPSFLVNVVLSFQPVQWNKEKSVRMRKEGGKSDCRQMTSLEDPAESKEALIINNKIK